MVKFYSLRPYFSPGYQRLSRLPGAHQRNTITVEFCGALEEIALYQASVPGAAAGVEHWLLEHPLFAACGEGAIYCHDQWGPFATDAHKFALFCNGVCHGLITGALDMPRVLHLHDWHSALVLFLRQYRYRHLQRVRCVYSIHNLSIQGVRPFSLNGSSLDAWYGISGYSRDAIGDPMSTDCVNMMRMGINMADWVHVVSPSYAREILLPSDPEYGFVGGEGLEEDLQKVAGGKRLVGILNGCEYPRPAAASPSRDEFISLAEDCLLGWAGNESHVSTAFFFARERLRAWASGRWEEGCVVASVSRLTRQKVSLLETEVEPGQPGLAALLERLGGAGIYIVLGSGDEHYERLLTRMMARHDNFLFLRGYSDRLSEALYRFCDLFLMPSSFEPCGISQMLAMRAGKPCLVHRVGGLADTVRDGVDGFSFRGGTPREQTGHMLDCFDTALALRREEPDKWTALSEAAAAARFSWDESVQAYLEQLYN